MKRLLIAAGLTSALVVACSEGPSDSNTVIPQGGSTAQGGGGSGGASGSSAGTAGGGGTTAGTGGSAGSGGAACEPACSAGQICNMGACVCPGYAPDHCAAAGVCTDFSEDPEHCGDCDTACAATSACSAGACTPEPSELYSTTACQKLTLALQGSTLYWVNEGAGTVVSMPVTGGDTTELASGLTDASAIAVDDTNVYVVTGNGLSRIPLGGGSAETVVSEATPIYDVAVQDGVLYYAVGTNVKSIAADADGGTGTVVATGVDNGEPQGVAVEGDYVLYASAVAYNVEVDSIAGDARVKLGASQGGLIFGAGSVRLAGTSVYWVNTSAVASADYTAEEVVQKTAASADDSITAFDVNDTTVYYGAGGNIEKAAFGEDSLWIARNQGDVLSMILDGTNVYWSTGDCKIRSTGL